MSGSRCQVRQTKKATGESAVALRGQDKVDLETVNWRATRRQRTAISGDEGVEFSDVHVALLSLEFTVAEQFQLRTAVYHGWGRGVKMKIRLIS